MLEYHLPPGVQALMLDGRPLLLTPQGGKVAVDSALLSMWEYAAGRTLAGILENYLGGEANPDAVRAGLACLAEAGMLSRSIGEEKSKPLSLAGPLVTAVMVSFNSREWLEESLPSLFSQTYTALEVVVVDNGSTDDTTAWVESHYPSVKLLRLPEVHSFAQATNLGVARAVGEYFFLLNPDVTLEPDAVAQLVSVAQSDPECAAVAAKLRFSWAPAFLNGIGNRVGAFSWGTDNGIGHLDLGQFDHWKQLPSACYAATLIPQWAWDKVGPADEGFPMYYEDSEWSYRARLFGYTVSAAPQAVIYHAFGGRIPSGESTDLTPRKLQNVVYGRLRFAIRLLGEYLPRVLRNYILEDWANFIHALVQRDWAIARAYLVGWARVIKTLPELVSSRKTIQIRRTISDEDLFSLQRDMPITLIWHGLPEMTWSMAQETYLPLIRFGRTRPMPEFDRTERRLHLLIISHDVVGAMMAGPGMRYLEMARALSGELDVTLAVPSETTLEIPGVRLVRYWEDRPGSLQVLVENSDVALVSGYMVEKFPFLETTRTRLVVDLYDPFVLENLHYYLHEPIESQEHLNQHAISITNRLAKIGDFFICGNERQRDYWMGIITANGRTNPRNFIQDPTMKSLLDIVGIGFPDREPVPRPLVRGIHPAVPSESRIVLWGGGIWNWLDPLTLIKAWPQVLVVHPEARLVFLGTRHPNPLVPLHEMAEKAKNLASEIGEKDRTILFIEWISYEEREGLLCEADVGVTLHPVHVETRFSMRTRVLDYLWARLPVLITEGDMTAEWIHQYRLGVVVPPFDVDAVACGLKAILDHPKGEYAQAFEPLQRSLTWSQAVQPLLDYCLNGGYAPDRMERIALEPVSPTEKPLGLWARAKYIRRTEGTRVFLHRFWRYMQWRLARF